MYSSFLGLIQAATPAPASGAPAGAPPPGGGMTEMIILFGMMFLVMWFVLIRPQRKEQKKRMEMLSQIKKNDHVVTTGGIFGVVQSVKENEVTLKIDDQNNTRIRILRSAILNVEKEATSEGLEAAVAAAEKK